MISYPLKHFSQRTTPIKMLVIHSMAFNARDGVKCLDAQKLSTHYIVDYDGSIIQCVEEKNKAWHAGISYWRGLEEVNSLSIGIEVCHQDLGQTSFNNEQINSLTHLCQDIIKRNNISPEMIVAHSDIAPTRKPDPGKSFPWEELSKHDVGLWYNNDKLKENDVTKLLDIIGYDTSTKEKTIAAAYAFRRRFLPKDIATMTIEKLLQHSYPKGKEDILSEEGFINTLQKVALVYYK